MVSAKGGEIVDYNFSLFNAITDALTVLEQAKAILIAAQQNAEEVYIENSSHPAGYESGE